MSLLKRHPIVSAALGAVGAVAVAPALASAACTPTATTQAFAKFGDTADYSLAPGGDFDGDLTGWTFTGGARVQYGNETTGVDAGNQSLKLPLNSSATSPAFCVDQSNPYFRFVSRPDNALAGYAAQVLYTDASGTSKTYQFTSSAEQSWGAGRWTPSKVSPLAIKIPLSDADASAVVRLRFVSTGNQTAVGVNGWGIFAIGAIGSTSIDSVFVDPYRRG